VPESVELNKTLKILVCDDDPMVRLLARECIEAEGMLVLEAEDGLEAISAYKEHQPDLIFLDVDMPELDGLQACEQIRALPHGDSVPILIATGAEDSETIDAGFRVGATQYKTKPINWTLLGRDIRYMLKSAHAFNELKAQESRLRYLAYFDHLTDLPNRRSFVERLRKCLIDSSTQKTAVGLILIGLDNFKRVNEAIGHERGDDLLHLVADRLQTVVASLGPLASDYPGAEKHFDSSTFSMEISRLGGDEFSVIVRNPRDENHILEITECLRDKLSQPLLLNELSLVVTPSIGIAIAPQHGTAPEAILRHADAAVSAAKLEGRNRIRVFDASLEESAERDFLIEDGLRQSLEKDGFYLVYQPQVNALTGKLVGFEVLLRWRQPDHQEISPAIFIPVAERTGLITQIGDWIFRQVHGDLTGLTDVLPPEVRFSVNLSPLQFTQSNFITQLGHSLRHNELPFQMGLELTEGVIMQSGVQSLEKLFELRALGFKLAIDDFGTGYSSLSYLRQFPIDTLKIDRSFVNDIGSPDGDALIKAILGMSQAMGLETVAEGVETAAQAHFLRDNGCHVLQGFLLSRPCLLSDISNVAKMPFLTLFDNDPSAP
jgi:predicted signal transduction protein with EAL and GGDEF domain